MLLAFALLALGALPGGMPCRAAQAASAVPPCEAHDATRAQGHGRQDVPHHDEAHRCCAVCAAAFSLRLMSTAPAVPLPEAGVQARLRDGASHLPAPPHEPATPPPRA